MGSAYTPGLKVTPKATIRKARRLPLEGNVLAKVGDRVAADQVVARTELPGKVYPMNLANQLSLLPEEVPAAMLKKEGEAVERDEVFAETRSFFGIFHSTVKSPIDGTVESVSTVTGQVLLRERPVPVEVKAYVNGMVVEVLPSEGVVVETAASFIQGIFGLGGEVYAPLKLAARTPDETVRPELIDEGFAGKIAIGGGRLTREALERLIEVKAAGVVTGGFAYQDIKDILGYDIGVAVTGGEKLGPTVMLTEGFGNIAMARATYELLASHDGKMASMNGATQIRAGVIRPEVVVSLEPGPESAGAGADHAGGMEVGAPVRCIRAPYFGRLGTIKELPVQLQTMPSETKVRVAVVALEGGEVITLPRANVELIER